jgi:hypothetical protein
MTRSLVKTHRHHKISFCRRSTLAVCLLLAPTAAMAHDGPPFPIVVDQKVGPCVISVWTDPDVGTGTFFVIVEAPPGGEVPADLKVQVSVQPVSSRLPEVTYPAVREYLHNQIQYKAAKRWPPSKQHHRATAAGTC